ncbi:MAG: hypothetical protein HY689_12520 [Chloroflexi bacterium]|nr:hypothetical protein [Chloroflexota bacterium]
MAITHLEVTRRAMLANGQAFGAAGPYEYLVGTVGLAVDPDHPANTAITDLKLAPRGEDGRVHVTADFALMRPVDPGRGAGRLLFDVLNRGRKLALRQFNAAAASSATAMDPDLGNGFLLRQGYTVAWCGWQHDVPSQPGLMAFQAPEALRDGVPVTGPILCEFQPDRPVRVLLLSDRDHRPYPAQDLNEPTAVLTVREHLDAPRQVIARNQWQFARFEDGRPVPDPAHISLATGFEPGKLYELVYTAQGAPVVGAGLLAVRDVVAWLKYGDATAGNPCAGTVRYAYGFGASQSGRFLRQFLYLGLNEDEQGRMVFDGLIPHIAGARRGEFNLRFGQPSKAHGQTVGALFPFSDAVQTDPVTGQTDGLLARLAARGKLPRIFTVNTAAEYWGSGQASLLHTDIEGTRDLEPMEMARIYLLAGTQHVAGTLPPEATNPSGVRLYHAANSVDYGPLLRAALVNLDRWVRTGQEPPPSQHPRLDNGTAVPPEGVLALFQTLPGVQVPAHLPQNRRLDFGPETAQGVLHQLPPAAGPRYPGFVPAVDPDGNEVAGTRLPDLSVPLATYTGWNVRHPEVGAPGEWVPMAGATLPFPRTAAERQATGDPRRAIAERYASKEAYLERVRQAALELVAQRYLLEEDVEPIVERAALRWDVFTAEP